MARRITLNDAAQAVAKRNGGLAAGRMAFDEAVRIQNKHAAAQALPKRRPERASFLAVAQSMVDQGRARCLSEAMLEVEKVAQDTTLIEHRARVIAQANPTLTWDEACSQALNQIYWNDPERRDGLRAHLRKIEERAMEIFRAGADSLIAARITAAKQLEGALRTRPAVQPIRDGGATEHARPRIDHVGRVTHPTIIREGAVDAKDTPLVRAQARARERGILVSEAAAQLDDESRGGGQ